METLDHIHIGGRKRVKPEEVIMFQADLNYSIVHFMGGRKVVVATTLKKLEDRFKPFDFVRMNKQYLINQSYIVEDNGNTLKMANAVDITFSRRKGKAWRDMH